MTDIKDMIQKHNDWLSGNPDGKRFIADGMNFSGETFKNANAIESNTPPINKYTTCHYKQI